MISFEQAQKTILLEAHTLGVVRRSLEKLSGLVLAETVYAGFDLPRFNNSAVDGFGVQWRDLQNVSPETPVTLQQCGTVQAGDRAQIKIKSGETVKILTGAPVPASVDAVVMQEFVDVSESSIAFSQPVKAGEHIRCKGEEFSKGQAVLAKGRIVTPPVIGLLANLGHASAKVYRKPKVGIIGTGNELVKPGKPLARGQIYDSNTYALSAALREIGIEQIRIGWAKDQKHTTQKAFEKALQSNDVIISLGGISVGEFDFVKDVAEQLGIETLFWRIAIKPGKPVYFGKIGKKLIFGLPGNPVSALVTYHQLVQPALLKMMGYPIQLPGRFYAELTQTLRKKPGRQEFVRGFASYQRDGFKVTPSVGQDSHMLGGLATANCLIDFPSEADILPEGSRIEIDWLSWTLDVF
jgi:molybdopterin molybdotransferase